MRRVAPGSTSPAWHALAEHRDRLGAVSLRALFDADPNRAQRLGVAVDGLHLDYSRQLVTDETLRLLCALAEQSGWRDYVDAMFRGDVVNVTEGRPALHVALRAPKGTSIVVDAVDVVELVHAELVKMARCAETIRAGRWLGHTGRAVRAVVNLGIGGSDLGPMMATEALLDFARADLLVRFASNVDGADLRRALLGLDPAETLFVVASKTFTTVETLTNARSARAWLLEGLGADADVARHFLAVSSRPDRAAAFGIPPEQVFTMWDWVGGRYSLPSAIGLPLMVAIGEAHFAELLAGFHAMDEHFRTAPLERNLPALLALLGVWCSSFLGAETAAVVPYSHALRHFPAYLQQLAMESNGKSVDVAGRPVAGPTGPIVWGSAGTNGQHAYFQLLHQGTHVVPVDLIGFATSVTEWPEHQHLLMASCFAQAEALAFGRSVEELTAGGVPSDAVAPRVVPGNRPTNVLLASRLDPFTLGQLVAAYEHKVFTEGILWGIDSFDQWGVELGKEIAGRLVDHLADPAADGAALPPSAAALVARYQAARAARAARAAAQGWSDATA